MEDLVLIMFQNQGNSNPFLVEQACKRKNVPHHLLNVSEYMNSDKYSFYGDNEQVLLDVDGRNIVPTAIFNMPFEDVGKELLLSVHEKYKTFVANELYGALCGTLLSLPKVLWMNTPQGVFSSNVKLYQLKLARSVGFHIPETIVSANSNMLYNFWTQQRGEVVTKAIFQGHLSFTDSTHELLYTSKVTKEILEKLPKDGRIPIMFQRYIEKTREFRVAVVSKEVFACSVGDGENLVDWRLSKTATSHSVPISLPQHLQESCTKLLKLLGLSFGVLDIVQDSKGSYYLLDVNQQGGYGWMETQLGLPISDSIVKHLVL